VDELERKKVKAWHEISGTSTVRFWGISIWHMEQLVKEYEQLEIVYESIRDRVPQEGIDASFANISACEDLTLDQKAIADFSLLALIEGSVPTPRGIECLKIVFHSDPEFMDIVFRRSGYPS